MGLAPLSQFGLIIGLAITGQWLASVSRIPSILVLLVLGFLAGPIFGAISPDPLFGEALFPIISFAVAIILFEGSLNLRLAELRPVRKTVLSLTTVGLGLTWILSTLFAWHLFDFPLELATLFGAILIVTGPTVVIPLLREIPIENRLRTVTVWEGIVNDPLGAVLCITTYEVVKSIGEGHAVVDGIWTLASTLGVGASVAIASTFFLVVSLSKAWIDQYLRNALVLGVILVSFVLAEQLSAEAGLVAVTLSGVILANQETIEIDSIETFNKDLEVVLLSTLFIILAARFDLESFQAITTQSYYFLAILILVIRPVSVAVAAIPASLNWREIGALSVLAPRGLVAAAMSALFALKLSELGYPQARQIDTEIFFLICGTVAIYGIISHKILDWLGVATDETAENNKVN